MSHYSGGRRAAHRLPDEPKSQPPQVKRARRLGIAVLTGSLVTASMVSYAVAGNPASDPAPRSADLVKNGSFTDGTTAWRVKDPARMTVVKSGRTDGSAVRLSTTSAATVVLNDAVNTVASTTKGTQFHISAWVRTTTPNVTTQLRVREVNQAVLANQGAAQLWLHDSAWHQISFDYTAQTAGATLDLNVVAWKLGATQSLDIDDVSMTTAAGVPVVLPTAKPTTTAPTPGKPSPTTPTTTKTTTTAPSKPTTSTTTTAPAGGDCTLNAKLVPSCGVLWGMYTKPLSGESWDKAFTNLEGKTGRKFDIVKRYHDWSGEGGNGQFPDASEKALGASGERILLFAWASNIWSTGGYVSWKDIASGKYDASIIGPEAQRIKAWGKPVFMSFDHESDGKMHTRSGTSADFVAAYRHIHDVFKQAGAGNVVWVYNPTGYLGNETKIKDMYPGDSYVDWYAWDPYNNYTCNGTSWKTPEQTFAGFYNWLVANGQGDKPLMLGEYGTAKNPSDTKAMGNWYGQVASGLGKLPKIKAAIMWDSQITGCDYRLSSSPYNIQGFAQSGLSDIVQGD